MAATSLILLQICVASTPIQLGQPAPCTGIIWTVESTKNALKCRRVELPTMTASWQLCEETKKIEINRLNSKLRTAQDIIDAAPEPAPSWVLPVVTVGSFLAGALSVVLLAEAL